MKTKKFYASRFSPLNAIRYFNDSWIFNTENQAFKEVVLNSEEGNTIYIYEVSVKQIRKCKVKSIVEDIK